MALSDSDTAAIRQIIEIHEGIAAATPGESSSADVSVAWCKRLLAEVERLTPDAKLGAAVRALPQKWQCGEPSCDEGGTWCVFVTSSRTEVRNGLSIEHREQAMTSGRTPDAALADAGLMGEGGDNAE